MRILLTGGSSFTGYWFARSLVEGGHEVVATLSSADEIAAYAGVRGRRVELLKRLCRTVFGAPFGSDKFLATLRNCGPVDVLCHHWAATRDYRSANFDATAALGANTHRLGEVLDALKAAGKVMILTQSVFEQDQGVGNLPMRAFSPYGLSKGLTADFCAYYCDREGIALDRFVIPNPFGPYEEPRFSDYLMRTWFNGEAARVGTPRYVRDNIHVSLLAAAYRGFVGEAGTMGGRSLGPTGYAESQGAFAERVAREVRERSSLKCDLVHADQTEFPEPAIRINSSFVDAAALGWHEGPAWDEFVAYYETIYARR